ncbi:MAG TPA: TolC family protein [Vicinamibacterales bacterium]|nr:TolC family protein [Vicinamibacterales bacterium]
MTRPDLMTVPICTALLLAAGGAAARAQVRLPAGAALVAAASPAAPATPPPVTLTLDEAIARGLAASHGLAALDATQAAAVSAAAGQAAARKPLVSLQAGYQRTSHVDAFGLSVPGRGFQVIYPDIPDNYLTRLDVQWPIYSGGRVSALERAARAEAGASGDDVATAREDLRLAITRAFWALVTARDAVQVVAQAHRRMEAHLKDVRNQFAVGLLPPNDVSAAEAQEARQRMLLIQAGNQRDVAAAALRQLLGLAPDTPVELQASLAPPPSPGPAAALVATALRHRPERQALVQQVKAAEAREAAAGAGHRPTVAVSGGVDYARPNPRIFPRALAWNESWDVGVNVSWPLWDAGRTGASVAQASAGVRAAEQRLAEFDSILDADVRERALAVDSSRAAITAADEAVRSAADARRVVEHRFKAGVATSTDVLDAQAALLQAELDRTEAIADARLAQAQLERVIGR